MAKFECSFALSYTYNKDGYPLVVAFSKDYGKITAQDDHEIREAIKCRMEQKLGKKLFRESFINKERSIHILANTRYITNAEIYGIRHHNKGIK